VFSREFRLNEDEQLKKELDKLVTLAHMASDITLSLLHKHHAMRKILRDHLMWWCSAHAICEKIKPPTRLIRAWAHCNDTHNHQACNRTIYKLVSSGQSFHNQAISSILVELEQEEYMKMSTIYPELSKERQMIKSMLKVLQTILKVNRLCTRQTLWYCSRLVIDARNFRLQAQYEVEYMWKCHATLSKVITTLSKLCKEKWSECYAEGRKGKM
ncbi:hypothetical protein Tco_0524482, partial [Tanacetum coccineum]